MAQFTPRSAVLSTVTSAMMASHLDLRAADIEFVDDRVERAHAALRRR